MPSVQKAYTYLLTRKGIAEKARATTRFLKREMAEYEALQREIELLRQVSSKNRSAPAGSLPASPRTGRHSA
jgi:molybdenum-dependent DNA-binding transcriptional regulator ModE